MGGRDKGFLALAGRRRGVKVLSEHPEPGAQVLAPRPTTAVAPSRLLLTVEEVGAAIGVSRSLMFEPIARGDIKTGRVGRLRLVRPEALQSYIQFLSS